MKQKQLIAIKVKLSGIETFLVKPFEEVSKVKLIPLEQGRYLEFGGRTPASGNYDVYGFESVSDQFKYIQSKL